jgi:hypothetical protein
MMWEIGTMGIWNRHLLSHHCQLVILLGVSLAFVQLACTANKEIAQHRPKYKPTTKTHHHRPHVIGETVATIHDCSHFED